MYVTMWKKDLLPHQLQCNFKNIRIWYDSRDTGYSESYVGDESVNSLCFSTAPFFCKKYTLLINTQVMLSRWWDICLSVSMCGSSHELWNALPPFQPHCCIRQRRPAARLTAFLVFIYVIDNSRAVLSARPLGCLQLSPHCLSPQRRTALEN